MAKTTAESTGPKAILQSSAALTQILLILGRANTGKTEICRIFNEFCNEAKRDITLIDLDYQQKSQAGSLGAVYGPDEVIRMGRASTGVDIGAFLWPQVQAAGKSQRPAIVDCAGSDLRLLEFFFKFNTTELALHYGVEVIAVFVVSSDPADWQYIEQIEKKYSLGSRKILIFNEKFGSRSANIDDPWESFKRLPVVKKLAEEGAQFAAIPHEDAIQRVSHLPVHRGRLGQGNAVSLALEPLVEMFWQALILAWYRQVQQEFPSDGIRLPWHV